MARFNLILQFGCYGYFVTIMTDNVYYVAFLIMQLVVVLFSENPVEH